MSSNKIILLSLTAFLIFSFAFLSLMEKKQADINTKNIWLIYFLNPKDKSLDFAVENHSDKTNFHWEILDDKNKLQEADVTVNHGQTLNVPVSVQGQEGNKLTVSVESNGEKKEIYKNF